MLLFFGKHLIFYVFLFKYLLDIIFHFKIPHQNIGTVLDAKIRGIQDHMVVIDIAPCLSLIHIFYLCAMSERSDAPDVIYRFLLYGFSYGKDTLHMLQEPAVFHAFEVSRQVTNEAHSFREFIRFANTSSGFPILVSHISPKANVLTLVAPHFSDRLPSENWMILDDNRQLAVVHPADRPFYLTRLSPDEIERLSLTESTSDPYEELWKGFFTAIAIKERSNPDCQRTHLPLHYRDHMPEFKNL